MRRLLLLLVGCYAISCAAKARANPALEGYANYAEMTARVEKLAASPHVQHRSLGKTSGGREIWLLTLGAVEEKAKPAILLVGGVQASHVAGSEFALRVAEHLVANAQQEKIAKFLSEYTLYVIPRPSPDAVERNFANPFVAAEGNQRRTDDDRDFEFGEDPPNDLNGDGWITLMRVADVAGDMMPHPDDPRVMVKADPVRNEHGAWRLYTEGTDDDHDGHWNEDGFGGVDFNRNFPFQYPFFEQQAGPNAVSEVESKAIADFIWDLPNLVLVFSFTPEDNLMHPWKPNGQAERNRLKETVLTKDAPYLDLIASRYREALKLKDAPASPDGKGSFSEWSYFYFGRWSLAARGWWIPQTPAAEGKQPQDKRAADELNALRWMDQEKIPGFVDWKPIEHPDFPGQVVEVGGFKPFYDLNPPATKLAPIAQQHAKFLVELTTTFPKLEIDSFKVESLGGGVQRLTARVLNRGYLPTMPEMGRISGEAYPLIASLEGPAEVNWLRGSARMRVAPISGNGGESKLEWLVRTAEGDPTEWKLKLAAPGIPTVDAAAKP